MMLQQHYCPSLEVDLKGKGRVFHETNIGVKFPPEASFPWGSQRQVKSAEGPKQLGMVAQAKSDPCWVREAALT